MKCVLCSDVITADPFGWEGGCNAEPIKIGKCCHRCDQEVVIPFRIAQYFSSNTMQKDEKLVFEDQFGEEAKCQK